MTITADTNIGTMPLARRTGLYWQALARLRDDIDSLAGRTTLLALSEDPHAPLRRRAIIALHDLFGHTPVARNGGGTYALALQRLRDHRESADPTPAA